MTTRLLVRVAGLGVEEMSDPQEVCGDLGLRDPVGVFIWDHLVEHRGEGARREKVQDLQQEVLLKVEHLQEHQGLREPMNADPTFSGPSNLDDGTGPNSWSARTASVSEFVKD